MSLRVYGKVGTHPATHVLIRSRRKLPRAGEWVWIRAESRFGHSLLQGDGRWYPAKVERIDDVATQLLVRFSL